MAGLSEYGVGRVLLAGKEYLSVELVVRPKKAGARGKTYIQYVVTIPKPVALELYRMAGAEKDEAFNVIALLSPAEWYHGLLWHRMKNVLPRLPEKIKMELSALGINPEDQDETVLVIAKKKQLEELGLDPTKPITLVELLKKILEKKMRTTIAKLAS